MTLYRSESALAREFRIQNKGSVRSNGSSRSTASLCSKRYRIDSASKVPGVPIVPALRLPTHAARSKRSIAALVQVVPAAAVQTFKVQTASRPWRDRRHYSRLTSTWSRMPKNAVHPSTKLRTNGRWIGINGEFPSC